MNLICEFHVKKILGEKYAIFTEKRYFPLNCKCKHSEIWNKFIKFQRKCFVAQPTNKVKKKCKFLQEFKPLLKQSETYRAQCVKHKEFWMYINLFNLSVGFYWVILGLFQPSG